MPDFKRFITDFEQTLDRELGFIVDAPDLMSAMRYSTLAGGKRIRPLLVYASSLLGDADYNDVLKLAVALELIHCYSLIHDDLPAMDDDDLRRNRPTCHIKYSESTAILAGDALQSLAFEILSNQEKFVNRANLLKIINYIAAAIGVNGMAGGQNLDLQNTGKQINLSELRLMHNLKTGALIKASILCGYLICQDNNESITELLELFADNLGLLFQITDDILDVTQSTEVLGKTANKDYNGNKATYVSLLGLEVAREMARDLYQKNIELLANLDNNEYLSWINDKVYLRNN